MLLVPCKGMGKMVLYSFVNSTVKCVLVLGHRFEMCYLYCTSVIKVWMFIIAGTDVMLIKLGSSAGIELSQKFIFLHAFWLNNHT